MRIGRNRVLLAVLSAAVVLSAAAAWAVTEMELIGLYRGGNIQALDEDAPAEVIALLLDAGANPKAKDKKGRGVDYYARHAYSLQGTEVMKRLETAAK